MIICNLGFSLHLFWAQTEQFNFHRKYMGVVENVLRSEALKVT